MRRKPDPERDYAQIVAQPETLLVTVIPADYPECRRAPIVNAANRLYPQHGPWTGDGFSGMKDCMGNTYVVASVLKVPEYPLMPLATYRRLGL